MGPKSDSSSSRRGGHREIMRAVAIALASLLGIGGHALAAPKKAPASCSAKVAKEKVLSYLGPTKGGWKIELTRKMGKIKVGGVTKTATKYFLWHAISNKKSYAPWDGTEGTPLQGLRRQGGPQGQGRSLPDVWRVDADGWRLLTSRLRVRHPLQPRR